MRLTRILGALVGAALTAIVLAAWPAAAADYDPSPANCIIRRDFKEAMVQGYWQQDQTVENNCGYPLRVFVYSDSGHEFMWDLAPGASHIFTCRADQTAEGCVAWSPVFKTKSDRSATKTQVILGTEFDSNAPSGGNASGGGAPGIPNRQQVIDSMEKIYSLSCRPPDNDTMVKVCKGQRDLIDRMKSGN